MTSEKFSHRPVLLQESLSGLNIKPDGIYIDATFGRGGHSAEILKQLSSKGRLIALDRDDTAIESAQRFIDDPRFSIHHVAFSNIEDVVNELELMCNIDGVLMDIGVSSPQLDDASRGFSFQKDGPLDMRMDRSSGISAADWLNKADLEEITMVLKTFGEEKFGKRIAHAVLEQRVIKPLETTAEFAQLIDKAVPVKDKFKHPATRSFQGVRIFINGELEQLNQGLEGAVNVLKSGGRLAVISFHSLEDRVAKRFIRKLSKGKEIPRGLPITQQEIDADKMVKAMGRAIKPSAEEIALNVRCRSSVLRVAEKL
ncbi:16S rRNA (cytosine(1402)-N(4))-methyltransferase RsmH [Brumicola pallidula]|jgi:16S rRNA (cytosine1402-N4)-methyltransferase|uniref:Ribosomal RNA small subunit methyltransferase H n=1 Tax=Brumicola pallidula DSM 14239 = ACAM 615 TaxID=1121922 RepID=K6YDR0_9ALTE|nr:16S rRNA (cytosine(1402)-N(4))-methyltransferase RsmH [Glaciecola pallidula]GAC30864.1 ribosomal RNA small subunit methyltransferase H [Glaciecola pallidula DSM 14239 = ACAM 615]